MQVLLQGLITSHHLIRKMGASQSSRVPVPEKMKRVVLVSPNSDMEQVSLKVETVDVPKPKSGQVLIKVAASPVNPSDYGVWVRSNPQDWTPKPQGHEGSGIVVASGGGFSTMGLVGKKVGFVNLPRDQGSYSEYVTVDAMTGVFPMPEDLPVEAAASFFVNPYTAYGILETAQKSGGKAFIHTAAASQLGQMLVRLMQEKNTGMELINVVRRAEQVELLKSLGAKHIVNTSEENWKANLKALSKKLDAKVAFDAVAGEMTGDLLQLLPRKSKVWVYGVLGGHLRNIDPIALIYFNKKVEGFLLSRWLRAGGIVITIARIRRATAAVSSGLRDGWSKTEYVDTTIEGMQKDFLKLYKTEGFTNKKLRVRFDD